MNWNDMSIGKKVMMGFGLVLVILAVVAAWSVFGIGGIVSNASMVIEGNRLRGELVQKEVDHLKWCNEVVNFMTDESVTELTIQTDPHKCAFGEWYYSEARRHAEELVPALTAIMADIEEPHNRLHRSAIDIKDNYHHIDTGFGTVLREAQKAHLSWMHKIKDAFLNSEITNLSHIQMDPRQCVFGKWYYSDEVMALRKTNPELDRIMATIETPHIQLHESARELDKLIREGKRQQAMTLYRKTTEQFAGTTIAQIDTMLAWYEKQLAHSHIAENVFKTETKPSLEEVGILLNKANELISQNIMTDEEMLSAASSTRSAVSVLSIVAVAAGVFLALVISRGIVKTLKRVIIGLSNGAEQVSAASEQVSASSQQLAEGSSQQASSLEEISSSLEEMTGMTRRTSDNANEADKIADTARVAAERGSKTMTRMVDTIGRIKKSSDETAKIIKTIDDIAFQTNLLALNAAVEAARAGDAGMGFAVVAEEVRALAQRSAEAARNTASLINESQSNADDGVLVTREVGEILDEIAQSSARVKQLIDEVSVASEEQTQGIAQINTAISQMDHNTQGSAANAEETASASEELTNQAMELQDMVGLLVSMIGHTENGNGSGRSIGTNISRAPRRNGNGKMPALQAPVSQSRWSMSNDFNAEDIIPLEDDHEMQTF